MTDTRVRTPARSAARAAGSAAYSAGKGAWSVARFSARHPRLSSSALVVNAAGAWVGYQLVLLGAGVAVLAGVSWWLLDHPTFDRFAGRLLRAWWRRWMWYQRKWAEVAYRCGLAQTSRSGSMHVPKLRRVRSTWCWDTVEVRMADAQKPEDYEEVLGRLANAYRARRASVRALKPGVLALEFQRREPFDDMVIPLPPLPAPAVSTEAVDLSRLILGCDEYGRPFGLDLMRYYHLLLAGETGAGKGSWLWGLIRALAPLVRCGFVRLWVIDPKGGMEFGAGEAMFHRFADNDRAGLRLAREYAATLDQRKLDLGRRGVRTAPVSADTPLELLICDELAAMVSWADRDITRDFEIILNKALTQYRAVGGRVAAATQEPTKDNIPMRGLFPYKVALRLAESSYVDMVLGEGARDRGALADQIPEILPGVAYLTAEGRREPLRVRAAYLTDADIADVVAYCTGASGEQASVTPLRFTTPADTIPSDEDDEDDEYAEVDYEDVDYFEDEETDAA